MSNKILLTVSLMISMIMSDSYAQKYAADWASIDSRPVPSWYEDAKFGIFIHWGVYSVPSWAPKGSYSEWYQYSLEQGHPTAGHHKRKYGKDFSYYQFAEMFKAEDFRPDHWAELIKESGAKYVVLTSKHHDGYCLWPSKEASRDFKRAWNSTETGPGRDLAGDLTQAVRKAGLKMGFYYSLYEWYNPLWISDRKLFVDQHFFPQVKDLVERYKPDILWADGEWEMSDKEWKSEQLLAWLYNESAVRDSVVVNDRWGKDTRKKHGGFYTTEYSADFAADKPWEECRGIGFSFGFNRNEDLKDYNSAQSLILMLANIVSSGGNLLLDIGPDEGGRIPAIMQERLSEIGAWMKVNGEAIYGSRKWKRAFQWSDGNRDWKPKAEGQESGAYILKQTVDPDSGYAVKEVFFTAKGEDLYAIVPVTKARKLLLKDIPVSRNSKVSILGSGKKLKWKKVKEGITVQIKSDDLISLSRDLPFTLKITELTRT